ncbi:Alpha/Beta hydrolase protein [Multifurca ochricompacta]|uniref:Alpha/Beta hydrolase protein n=1 Tax=Multifurca ochricompacta TaxID=376703 RepID=A0AAD4M331_9AGAM|nr:Alpha/Beta hydrolase protein [Multifurca ochricompacta]
MSTFTEAWLPGLKSSSFYTRTYAPASGTTRGVIVFIHGFIEHVARYEYVHKRWADRGFVVFTFDQRGFGRTALDPKKSPGAVYGRTDVAWAYACPGSSSYRAPGGGLVLSFATRANTQDSVSQLSGIIATSPCIRLTKPPASVARRLGSLARSIFRTRTFPLVKANEADPLIRRNASLRAVDDMLRRGENLDTTDHKKWPTALPVLVVHGTEDMVLEQFIEKLPASDKKISLYEGGYHELQNEPDGVKEKFTDECVAWAEAHFPTAATEITPARL